jgi:cytochrome c peroxidase
LVICTPIVRWSDLPEREAWTSRRCTARTDAMERGRRADLRSKEMIMRPLGNDARPERRRWPHLWEAALGASALLSALLGCQEPAPVVPPSGALTSDGPPASSAAPSTASTTSAALAAGGAPATPAPPPTMPRVEIKRDGAHGAQKMPDQLTSFVALATNDALATAPNGVNPGYWQLLVPKDNALDARRIALGKKLYFDTRLSKDGTVACATCHDVSRGFTDRRNASEGIGGQVGRRNAPTTMNAVFFQSQFWDGRAAMLEDQAKLPITNPIEMGQPDGPTTVKAIAGDAEYKTMFKAAYNAEPNFEDLGRALAAFERTLVFLDAPYDRFVAGKASTLSDDAKAGWALFNGKARCVSCHQLNGSSPIGTDQKFHNVGVSARHQDFAKLVGSALAALAKNDSKETMDRLAIETDVSELGRFVVTRSYSDIGAFKTQQIRNVGITGPYMHDGSMQTLWDVMDHYNKGGEANAYLDGGIEPLNLSEREIDQVVAFLFTLTDARFGAENEAEFAHQREVARTKRPFRDDALVTRKVFPFETRPGTPGVNH